MLLSLIECDIIVPDSVFFRKNKIYDQKNSKLVVKVNSGISEKFCSFIFNKSDSFSIEWDDISS